MGHEYAHIYRKHLENAKSFPLRDENNVKNILFSWPQEEDADFWGMLLMFGPMKKT